VIAGQYQSPNTPIQPISTVPLFQPCPENRWIFAKGTDIQCALWLKDYAMQLKNAKFSLKQKNGIARQDGALESYH
jgi:hypothetical protein